MIEKFTGDAAREARRSVFRSSVDNFSPAARTIHQNPLYESPSPFFLSASLSLSLSFTHLYLYTVTNFSYDRLLFPTPLPNSDSVRKFSFGSRPVFHLKQPTNRPTYDFTLYFPSFSLRARAFFATSPLYLSISLFSACPSLLHPPPSSRPNSQDKFRDCR